MSRDDFEDEEIWLGHRLRRLRTILRFAKDARVEAELKQLIAEAEERLDALTRQRSFGRNQTTRGASR